MDAPVVPIMDARIVPIRSSKELTVGVPFKVPFI
jgi:hypothetical protein